MKWLFVLLIVGSPAFAAPVCGLYQVEDFGDRITYSITRLEARWQTVYTVTNPGFPVVKNMLSGMCYCVEGEVQPDPEFVGDENFQLVTVSRIEAAAYAGCASGNTPP